MKDFFARVLDLAVGWGLWAVVFLAPLKWGLPVLEPDKVALPMAGAEWLAGSWPVEALCLAVYFLFFLHAARCLFCGSGNFSSPPIAAFAGPVLFLAMSVVSARFSAHPGLSLSYNLTYGAYALFFILLLWRRDMAVPLCLALAASAGTVALYAVFQRFSGFAQTAEWARLYFSGHSQLPLMQAKLQSGRVFSTLVYPNSLGGFLLMALPVTAAVWVDARRGGPGLRRVLPCMAAIFVSASVYLWLNGAAPGDTGWLSWHGIFLAGSVAAPAAELAAMLFSESQGTFAVLGVLALGTAVFFVCRRWKGPRRLAALAALGIFCAACLVLCAQSLERIKWDTLLMRWGYWAAAGKMIWAEGLTFGFGPGSFGAVYPRFKWDWVGETQLAHSHVLQIAAESGLIAAVGWALWWLGWALLPAKRLDPKPSALLRWGIPAGLAGFLLHGFLDFDFFIPGITVPALVLCAAMWHGRMESKARAVLLPLPVRGLAAAVLAVVLLIVPFRHFSRSAAAQGYFAQGVVLAGGGRWAEAGQAFALAGKAAPDIAAYRFYEGLSLERQGRPQEAMASYRAASRLAPAMAYYHYRIAVILAPTDRTAAEKALLEALRNYPGNPEYALALKTIQES